MMTVVPSPTFVWISNASDTFFILGRPMPAPNPLARIFFRSRGPAFLHGLLYIRDPRTMVDDPYSNGFRRKIRKDLAPAAMDQTIDFPFVGSNGNAAHKFRREPQLLEHFLDGN